MSEELKHEWTHNGCRFRIDEAFVVREWHEASGEWVAPHPHDIEDALYAGMVGLSSSLAMMTSFVNELLDPEMYGHAVSMEVRDDARELLGMPRVETGESKRCGERRDALAIKTALIAELAGLLERAAETIENGCEDPGDFEPKWSANDRALVEKIRNTLNDACGTCGGSKSVVIQVNDAPGFAGPCPACGENL